MHKFDMFVPRLKVKGKVELSDGWSDVLEGGDASFRFFTVLKGANRMFLPSTCHATCN